MSEPTFPDSPVFTDPASVPPIEGQDPNAIDATAGPGKLGGVGNPYTTVPAQEGQVQQVVLSGQGNRLNLNTGAAYVNVTGGGSILESVALVDENGNVIEDEGKYIKLTAGDNYNGATVNTQAAVSGDTPGSEATIEEVAGGQIPEGGFAFYASGGSGNDAFIGSGLSDFIRGGGGDDTINAGGGDDLVRGGSGSDDVFLGTGQDTLYFTLDQIDNSLDTVRDFTTGEDKISLAAGINYEIVDGGRSIVFTYESGGQTFTSTLTSTGDTLFTDDDIVFLG